MKKQTAIEFYKSLEKQFPRIQKLQVLEGIDIEEESIENSRWAGNDNYVSQYKNEYINSFLLLEKLILEKLKTDASSPKLLGL
ncbi:hypothetical protein F7018_07955 [Tenacibaculum aiptasiae]|uniref:Uncharacterized protein n=1 Tax=Tenacibaculum aiptasiae TaxID=426481 RepID=A0A7J5ALZ0_9FLAO|nr:hypothetical protein [Tenacibaculum aiptasiae]KAB1158543.1 hypothetical protein F7018_07955 [Tenacibaculum aiptasiae]